MKIKTSKFHGSAAGLDGCPDWHLREFALIGRSNVGKSSLVNSLCGGKEIAKVSATPGKTRLINLFIINDAWSLVDLPGYGFAKVSKQDKFDFNEAVGNYIAGRPNLAAVFVLIDSRIPPQRIDLDFIAWLATTGVRYSLIFTKTEKQSAGKLRTALETFSAALAGIGLAMPEAIATSARTGDGRLDILRAIGRYLEP